MAKPASLPTWATDGGTTLEPSAPQKAAGWVQGEAPPARWMNWLLNLIYQWIEWLDAVTVQKTSRFALSVFRVVSGTTPAVLTNEIEVDFQGADGVIRIPVTVLTTGCEIVSLSGVFVNDGGNLTIALKTGVTTLFSVSQIGTGNSTPTDDNGATPYVVLSTDCLYLEIAGASLTGTENTAGSIAVVWNPAAA